MGTRTIQRADALLWVGDSALYIWDGRDRSEGCIRLLGKEGEWFPYVPGFYDIWEDAPRYQRELRSLLGGARLWGRRRVLLVVPEDLTQVESVALEDFVYAAMGGGLKRRGGVVFCSQSEALRAPEGRYIAVTHSCRCYCTAVVQDGAVVEKALMDVNECTREALLRQIREFHSLYRDSAMEVYFPQMEANLLLDGIGGEVSLAGIAAARLY